MKHLTASLIVATAVTLAPATAGAQQTCITYDPGAEFGPWFSSPGDYDQITAHLADGSTVTFEHTELGRMYDAGGTISYLVKCVGEPEPTPTPVPTVEPTPGSTPPQVAVPTPRPTRQPRPTPTTTAPTPSVVTSSPQPPTPTATPGQNAIPPVTPRPTATPGRNTDTPGQNLVTPTPTATPGQNLVTPTPTPVGELPNTGTDPWRLIYVATGLLAVGAALVIATRR